MSAPFRCLLTLAVAFGVCQATWAENVDLSTVPRRDSVQLTIYNNADITLVRETRVATFKKGVNPLQFSWANTLIDPSSVELKFLTSADKLDVADTAFLHDKPQRLYWNVKSEINGQATIQITYFTIGITWSADYIGIAAAEESTMDVEGFVRVTNQSGEEYENAQIRLVVGTLNLVEKIAELAQIPMNDVGRLAKSERLPLKNRAVYRFMDKDGISLRGTEVTKAPQQKQVIKEGLSEYFIYTIEGTETIANGWSKRIRSFEARGVPFKIQYRYRPKEYGDPFVRMYLMTNDKESKLGTTPLPDGAVRVFRNNGRDGLSYLAQQSIRYVPIGDKIELNLGPDPDVAFELEKLRTSRSAVTMQINGENTYRQAGDEVTAGEVNSSVVGWDDHNAFRQRIRNCTDKAIDVEIRRSFDGHVVFRSQLTPKMHDYQTVEFGAQVPAGARQDLLYEILQHQGHNAKQMNATIESAPVKL